MWRFPTKALGNDNLIFLRVKFLPKRTYCFARVLREIKKYRKSFCKDFGDSFN